MRRDLISERHTARAELKELRRLREVETEELNLVKAPRDSLRTGFDESENKLKEAANIIEALNKMVANLEGSLKGKEDAFTTLKGGCGIPD